MSETADQVIQELESSTLPVGVRHELEAAQGELDEVETVLERTGLSAWGLSAIRAGIALLFGGGAAGFGYLSFDMWRRAVVSPPDALNPVMDSPLLQQFAGVFLPIVGLVAFVGAAAVCVVGFVVFAGGAAANSPRRAQRTRGHAEQRLREARHRAIRGTGQMLAKADVWAPDRDQSLLNTDDLLHKHGLFIDELGAGETELLKMVYQDAVWEHSRDKADHDQAATERAKRLERNKDDIETIRAQSRRIPQTIQDTQRGPLEIWQAKFDTPQTSDQHHEGS